MSFMVFDVRNVIGEETVGVKEEKDDGRSLLSRARPNSGEPRRRGGGRGMINNPLSLIDKNERTDAGFAILLPVGGPRSSVEGPPERDGRTVRRVSREQKNPPPPPFDYMVFGTSSLKVENGFKLSLSLSSPPTPCNGPKNHTQQ